MHFKIFTVNPHNHIFQVELTVNTPAKCQELSLPAWIPGSYMIRDFAKNILSLECFDSKKRALPVSKLDKQRWQVSTDGTPLTVVYQVYALDMSVRSAYLDSQYGFFNGTSVFLEAKGVSDKECSVEILPPQGDEFNHWQLITGLRADASTQKHSFGRYYADNYQQLIDTPVMLGEMQILQFEVNDIPHYFAVSASCDFNHQRLIEDLIPICQGHMALFDDVPFSNYTFMLKVLGDGYGGLEHHNSTALICNYDSLPSLADDTELRDDYLTLLGLCSHEYLHSWNVKQMKPKAFVPYQLDSESYTEQMWIYEGFTSYYDDLMLLRAGLIDNRRYLDIVSKLLSRFLSGKGHKLQTVTASSFDAWTRFYQQTENAPNAIVSYYTKGALIALCLDILMRDATNGEQGLDDIFAQMWQAFGKNPRGSEENEVEQLIKSQFPALADFVDTLLYSTDDIPFNEVFNLVGVRFDMRPPTSHTDVGGKYLMSHQQLPHLGAKYSPVPTGLKLSTVYSDGAAEKAGLQAGDIIIALDNIQVSSKNLDTLLQRKAFSESYQVSFFRAGVLCQASLNSEVAPFAIAQLSTKCEERIKTWLQPR